MIGERVVRSVKRKIQMLTNHGRRSQSFQLIILIDTASQLIDARTLKVISSLQEYSLDTHLDVMEQMYIMP